MQVRHDPGADKTDAGWIDAQRVDAQLEPAVKQAVEQCTGAVVTPPPLLQLPKQGRAWG